MGQAGQEFSWIAARPVTGRTHQIACIWPAWARPSSAISNMAARTRVDAAAIADKLHLHARSIDIARPDGGRLQVTAPLSPHMVKSWQMLGFDPDDKRDPFPKARVKATANRPRGKKSPCGRKRKSASTKRSAPAAKRRAAKDEALLQDRRGRSHGPGWRILLDGRPVKTPGRNTLLLPTQALAEAVAEEWRSQGEEIDPVSMPLLRLSNTVLDGIQPNRADVIGAILRFGEHDLLCYHAEAPLALAERQRAEWTPLLNWVAENHGAHLAVTSGINHIVQDAGHHGGAGERHRSAG